MLFSFSLAKVGNRKQVTAPANPESYSDKEDKEDTEVEVSFESYIKVEVEPLLLVTSDFLVQLVKGVF